MTGREGARDEDCHCQRRLIKNVNLSKDLTKVRKSARRLSGERESQAEGTANERAYSGIAPGLFEEQPRGYCC